MGKIRLPLLLLLVVTLSHVVCSWPYALPDSEILTKPKPGEEFVQIQHSSKKVPSTKEQKHNETSKEGFATSHKIPVQIASKKYMLSSSVKPENLFSSSHKINRNHAPIVKRSAENDRQQTQEIRTEYSVVTSKTQRYVPEIKIQPNSNSGVIEEKLEGADEHRVMIKKHNADQDRHTEETSTETSVNSEVSNVEIKPASQVGVKNHKIEQKDGEITVPFEKKQITPNDNEPTTTTVQPLTSTESSIKKSNFDIIPVNYVADKSKKEHEKDLDFVDSPLDDKLLIPQGSENKQQSRIEVKKGPNGQDYEYEYVYYYYDDDEENDNVTNAKPAKTETSTVPQTTTTTTTTSAPTERTSTSGKRYLPTASSQDISEETTQSSSARVRSRNRNQPQGIADHPNQLDDLTSKPSNGRNRYTTIERNKGEASTSVAPEASNEVLPPSRGSRFRGRQLNVQSTPQPAEEVAEERLPANTRFPPRSRTTVTTPATEEATPIRGRSNNAASAPINNVRRPSLELVDSSSFRTHSSDVSRNQDFGSQSPSFPSVLPAGPFRFLGVTPNEDDEEKESKSRIRGRGRGEVPAAEEDKEPEVVSSRRGPHIRRPSSTTLAPQSEESDDIVSSAKIPVDDEVYSRQPAPVTENPDETDSTTDATSSTTEDDTGLTPAIMDKAALDLYAILQQAQAENASNFIDENATESGTDADEDESTTDEAISTTVALTTSTTTTTTTTTTEAPTTTTTTEASRLPGRHHRPRIGGNRLNGGSQSKFRGTSTTTESAPVETSTKTKPRFGSTRTSGGSFGRRGHPKTKPVEEADSVKEENKEVASTVPKTNGFSRGRFGATRNTKTTTTAAPNVDSSPSATTVTRAPHPDRFNPRRRGSVRVTTSAPATTQEEAKEEHSEANESTTKAPVRSRLNIGGGPRPLRPGPKINIGGRPRIGSSPLPSTSTTQAPPTEASEAPATDAEAPSESQDHPQEAVTTPVPDALTRLRNRPRLQVSNGAKTTAVPPVTNSNSRRHLVSSLLPKRKPLHPGTEVKDSATTEGQNESETPASPAKQEESSADETTPAATTSENQEVPKENRLSSLLSGRRRVNAARRPGTLFPSSNKQEAA